MVGFVYATSSYNEVSNRRVFHLPIAAGKRILRTLAHAGVFGLIIDREKRVFKGRRDIINASSEMR
jgi:hypothetical protein